MKRILVGLDGSPRQEGVYSAAVALAAKTGASLCLFRCIDMPNDIPSEIFELAASHQLPVILGQRAERDLDLLAERLPPEVKGDVRIVFGSTWRAIVGTAQDLDVDLIVIGSHGYDAFDRVLGTTAARVVNHADRAVLVVRAPERLR